MSKYTREQIDKARQKADYAFDHAYDGRDDEAGNRHRGEAWIDAFTEALGLEVEDDKPEPGTWHMTDDGHPAFVDNLGWLRYVRSDGVDKLIRPEDEWPDLTPAKVVPAAPVELSEEEFGREFDAIAERDGFIARWVNYTNEARYQYTRIWNAAIAKHGHGRVEVTRADMESALIVDELRAMRARVEAATEGPWWTTRDLRPAAVFAGEGSAADLAVLEAFDPSDATFTAQARTDLPKLLDVVERVMAISSREPLTIYDADSYTIGHSDGFNAALDLVRREITEALDS